MSVSDSISNALTRFGRAMVLRRLVGPAGAQTKLDVTVMGTDDGNVVIKLLGQVPASKNTVIFSNQPLAQANWPGPPRKNDLLIIDGKPRTVDGCEPKYLGTEILVHICQLSG